MKPQLRRFLTVVAFAAAPLSLFAQTAKPYDPSIGAPKRGNAHFYELHAQDLKRAKQPMQLLFIGDSITEGWGKAPDIWAANYEKYQAANFGISGDRTEHVIWRIEDGVLKGVQPKVVVLMLGTNNSGEHTGEQIAAADKKIVELIRANIPEAKVLLLAIFPRGPRKDKEGKIVDDGVKRMQVIHEANAILAKLDDGKNVRFLDIGAKFLDADGKIPDAVMPDQLHPNVAGYQIWADAMRPLLEEMMK
ncbi:MAG TPA: GDSL-type esterase/lipase family protein [Acidobacteriota bacterium]|nr:GDSL-type esterase/lipase family protein [Acidobacteriota bacterium]